MTSNDSSTPSRRQRIKFSEDWDKLKAPRFTTIRTWRADKEEFYRAHVGETFTVLRVATEWSVRGRKFGEAILLKVERVVPKSLPLSVLVEDVRKAGAPSSVWMERLSRMDDGLLLTFENLTGLLERKAFHLPQIGSNRSRRTRSLERDGVWRKP